MIVGLYGGEPDFDPINVAGCIGCWDVDDVVDSSGASSLPDRSGNGNHLAQATAGARLAVVHNDPDFAGHKSLQGATGDSILITALVGGSLAQPITKYALIRTGPNVTTNQYFFASGTGVEGSRVDIGISGGRFQFYANTTLLTSVGSATANTRYLVKAVFNGLSTSVEITPVGGSPVTATGNVGTSALGGTMLMAFPASSAFLGKGAYFILYAGIVSDADDAKIKAFLRTRFGIT